MEKKFKEFGPTSWAIDNKTSIYVLVFVLVVFGLMSYINIPKEQFPDIVIPTYTVSTVYPGTSPSDMENLVTRPVEKNLKSISGVKKISSRSFQDFSSIVVEFNTDVKPEDAKQKVKDAVDKTAKDLPSDLKEQPAVNEIDFSDIPIMFLNLSGDIPLDKLKIYADKIKDKIESLKEITRVDIVGALDREIQVNLDMYKMQVANITFRDIENAIKYENVTVSGGSIDMQGMSRSIRVVGEFKNVDEISNIIINTTSGASVRLKDIANINDTYHKQESFARFEGKNVITLNVVKKSGQNLIESADKIQEILKDMKKNVLPSDLKVEVTGDMSHFTRTTLEDLNNTIIIGFILVTIVLMFFMGFTNAFFVGLSVPLSMALAYIILPQIGFTMNMLVMFAFIFALGIVVDDAIVVVENTHRIFVKNKGKYDITHSAKFAAGEVFKPILSGTLTTLAPFFPLAFWPGIVGKFMHFIPITLIITLFASLIVAYIINPVFAVKFMAHDDEDALPNKKRIFNIALIWGLLGGFFHLIHFTGTGNLMLFIAISYVLHSFYGYKVIRKFQTVFLPKFISKYDQLLQWVLVGKRPYRLMAALIVLLFFSIVLTIIKPPKAVFFPSSEPNNVYAYIKTPVGTSVNYTDSIATVVASKIQTILGKDNPVVESVITNVAFGASENRFDSYTKTSNRAKITVNFVEYAKRHGVSTSKYLEEMRKQVKNMAGVEITIDGAKMGPPTGKPVNIEVSGDNLEDLISASHGLKKYIDSLKIAGIEELKLDFETGKPEIVIQVDRQRANKEGISSGQVGSEIRTALNGNEVSKYRDGEDQYPIILEYNESQRNNIDQLLNLKITYRDMASGLVRQIPLSSVTTLSYQNSYGGINRLNVKRVITVSSNVLTGANANQIVSKITAALPKFSKKEGIEIKITGEQEDQKETGAFMGRAMLLALFLIIFILITQFNSVSKTFIIIIEVLFSVIGVLLGYIMFGLDFSFVMSGLGIVALAGIVVRNGILLVEFTDVMLEKGLKTRMAIIEGGKARITPVLLTATATILGLIPLAVGFNIDFIGLFQHLSPNIHFGGDNVAFFGTLAWTIIFGLSFATVLTLIYIPIMYFMAYAGKVRAQRGVSNRKARRIIKSMR